MAGDKGKMNKKIVKARNNSLFPSENEVASFKFADFTPTKRAEEQNPNITGTEVKVQTKKYSDIFYQRYAHLANVQSSVEVGKTLEELQAELKAINIFFDLKSRLSGRYSPHLRMVREGIDEKDEVKNLISLLKECSFSVKRYRDGSTFLVAIFRLQTDSKFQENKPKLAEFAKTYNTLEQKTIKPTAR